MSENSNSKKQPKKPDAREDRLKAALKANMARRKTQAKARASAEDNDAGEPQARFSGQAHRSAEKTEKGQD